MAEEPNLNNGYLGNQVFSGIVQFAVPSMGWALVIPTAANKVDKGLICRLPGIGGIVGGGVHDCPPPGTLVTVRRQKDTDMGYIVSINNQGTQEETYAKVARLRQSQLVPCVSSMQFIKKIIQRVQEIDDKQKATFTGALQDQYAGDTVIGDRHGPNAFFGRSQLEIKGTDLSYIQMNALEDKITTVTVESQFDTFSDKNTVTTDLNKTLKASGDLQGLGGRGWETDSLLVSDSGDRYVKYKKDIKDPIFRFQQFNGGAARGCHTTLVCPLKEKEDKQPVVMTEMNSYNGEHLRLSTRGNTFIKTPFAAGLVEKHFIDQSDAKNSAEELIKKFDKIKLSDNGTYRALQLDAIIKEDTRKLLYDMLGTAATEIIGEDVDPFPEPFGTGLEWQGDEKPSIATTMGDYPTLDQQDQLLGTTVKRFKNTSFITQDPDGSITLKDGWGSQITMSHGNIYISSALDTFIRPGRKLIAMVPSDLCVSTNGEVELASRKDIKVGAEKNLTLSSAIGGQEGYTVLENRTKKKGQNSGMVIRSNGYLTVTSSDDMHIGINDKRQVNKEDGTNQGTGSIFIEGKGVRIESSDQLRLTGNKAGIYAYQDKQGCGLQISTGDITLVSPIINMDTGAMQVGKFATTYAIQTGPTGENTVTLKKGGDSLTFHVRGQVQCKGLVDDGFLHATGACIAANYSRLQTTPQVIIYGSKKPEINAFKSLISRLFKTPLRSSALSFMHRLQSWYKDSFICKKELSFTDSWSSSGDMPAMCWQLQEATENYDPFYKISVKSTGKNEETCSYPGKKAWEQNSIITVDSDYNIKTDLKLENNYKTYTKEGK